MAKLKEEEPFTIYASGADNRDEPQDLVLYISQNDGNDWESVVNENVVYGGVEDMLLERRDNFDEIYMAASRRGLTNTEGVYKFRNDMTVAVENKEIGALSFFLNQNYPNPFNPTTRSFFPFPKKAESK